MRYLNDLLAKELEDITREHLTGEEADVAYSAATRIRALDENCRGYENRIAELEAYENLPAEVLTMCVHRGRDMEWIARGCYLHLEASELIESLRGEGDSSPLQEAADVLLVLMSITEHAGIQWSDVLAHAAKKNEQMMGRPHYAGEDYDPRKSDIAREALGEG